MKQKDKCFLIPFILGFKFIMVLSHKNKRENALWASSAICYTCNLLLLRQVSMEQHFPSKWKFDYLRREESYGCRQPFIA